MPGPQSGDQNPLVKVDRLSRCEGGQIYALQGPPDKIAAAIVVNLDVDRTSLRNRETVQLCQPELKAHPIVVLRLE